MNRDSLGLSRVRPCHTSTVPLPRTLNSANISLLEEAKVVTRLL